MSKSPTPAPVSARTEIEAFLDAVRRRAPATVGGARGRLVFALDATMSRQPTWDSACVLQTEMFREAAAIGGLEVQLVYFRGLSECRASGWIGASGKLAELMGRIDCRGGHTQIGKVLAHARQEHLRGAVQAVVFVGDAMEERLDDLCRAAGELGLLGIPVFMFQEGHDPVAAQAFREIARLSGGAHCRFDAGAAQELGALLRAVAAYAAGGRAALAALASRRMDAARKLLAQLS